MILGGGTPPPYAFPGNQTKVATITTSDATDWWKADVGIETTKPLGSFGSLDEAIKSGRGISAGYASHDEQPNQRNGVAVVEAQQGVFKLFPANFYAPASDEGGMDVLDFEFVGRSTTEGPFFNRRYTGWNPYHFEAVGDAGRTLRALVDGPVVVKMASPR